MVDDPAEEAAFFIGRKEAVALDEEPIEAVLGGGLGSCGGGVSEAGISEGAAFAEAVVVDF